jgi:hypothetical protein
MPKYEDLSEDEQNAAIEWQQAHTDSPEFACLCDDMPNYIVALVNSNGVLFALGIETAYQVWQRALQAWYYHIDHDPIMIAPVTDPHSPNIHGRMNWSIPLVF